MSNPFIRTTRSPIAVRNGQRDWFRIRNARADVAEIDLYDEIGFFGITAADFRAELKAVTAGRITLHINSPGGDVFDAVAIYNALRDHPAEITTVVDSLAASAASFIALAGDRVVMSKHAQMMIHDAWGMALGNADDMRKAAEFLDRQSDVIAGIYADRAGGTVEEWRALMAEETWFSDEEAVEAGLAHEIGSQQAAKNSFDLSVFRNAPVMAEPEREQEATDSGDDQPDVPDWRKSALLQVAAARLEVAHADSH